MRVRIAVGLMVLVAASAAISGVLYRVVGNATHLLHATTALSEERSTLLELERTIAHSNVITLLALSSGDDFPIRTIEYNESSLRALLAQRRRAPLHAEEASTLARFEDLASAYHADLRRIQLAYTRREPATEHVVHLLGLRRQMVDMVGSRNAVLEQRQLVLAPSRADSAFALGREQMFILVPGLVLLGGAVGFALLRTATRPLKALAGAIDAVAAGDLSFRLHEDGLKEFTDVARKFNRLVEDRLAAEAERERLALAIDQAGEVVLVTLPDTTIVYANPAFERVSGYSREEAIGRTPKIVSSGRTSRETYADLWNTVREGRTWKGELTNRRKDGSLYIERQTITPIRDASGKVQFFVSIGADITVQRRLETQLSQAAKMEAIGRLAGGVAHDFNNLLMVITAATEKLSAALPPWGEQRDSLDAIGGAAERAAGLTRRLLAFSRQQAQAPRAVNLNEIIRGMEPILRRLIGADVQVLTCTSSDLPLSRIDPGHVEQVLLNLAVNARDAMPGGGRLLFETALADVDAGAASRGLGLRPGRYVRLTVSDTGTGMDQHTQAHLFEPFFTTKPAGKGTGLGLSTVYGIVSQYDGYIDVVSELGQGTTFHVFLPACADPAEVAVASDPQPSGAAARGTVLLAEDDEDVRGLLAAALQQRGHKVLVASNGIEALALAQSMSRIDVLVTDIVMPRMGGIDLSHRLASQFPKVRVVYLTGYAPEGTGDRLLPGAAFLQKPVPLSELCHHVSDLLTDRPPPEALIAV